MQHTRNRPGRLFMLLFGFALMMLPHSGWALRKDVALVLARTGAVIQCGENAILLRNELRIIPQGLLAMSDKIASYVKQVAEGTTGGTRGFQAVTHMDIGVVKHRKMPLPAIWLVCNLDNITDPHIMDGFLHTSKHDNDRRCSVKNFDNEKLDDARFIVYVDDSNHATTGTVTVQDRDTEGIITILKQEHITQSDDAEKIILLVGENGTTIDPQSRCNNGEVPVVKPMLQQ